MGIEGNLPNSPYNSVVVNNESLKEAIFSLGEEHKERCDRINSAFIVQYLPFFWFIHLVKLNILGA